MAIRFRQFVKNHRKAIGSGLVLFICAVVLVPQAAEAQWYKDVLDGLIMGVAWLVYFIAWLGGQLLVTLITILVWVASYNNFINEPIVSVGWTIIRDLCNMAFIIALLYMAFNMVFGLRKGGSLLTLIINAGLINFSKVISGFVIDISQVVMLTFVNGFYKIAGGNILEGLGFTKMFEMVKLGGTGGIDPNAIPGGDGPAGAGTVLISIVFALILIYIAVGMVLTFIIMLVGRIFKLWGLLITSPVPFVKKILPGMPDVGGGGGNYWGELAKTAAAGPILAFWLWLIFTSVSLYNRVYVNTGFTGSFGDSPAGSPESLIQGGGGGVGWSQAGTLTNIMSYIIFIGLMMLALQQAQSQANAMHSIVGNAAKKLRGGAHKWTMKGLKTAGEGLADWRVFGKKDAQTGQRTSVMDVLRRGRHAWDLTVDRSPKLRELLTKEGRKTKSQRRDAEAKATVHSAHAKYILKKPDLAQRLKSSLTTRNLFSQANEQVKKLKDAGALEQQSDAEIAFQEALDGKDMARAVGVARHMAEQGWGVPAQMMQRIMQTFKTIQPKGELHKQLVNDLGKKASSAKNANQFRSKSADPVTEDPLTGELSWADPIGRAKAADKAIMEEADFEKVDEEFNKDKRLLDATGIADDSDELYVRLANIASWGKATKAHAKDFENPDFARRWLSRRGSEEIRKEKADKMDQLIGLAERKGVKLSKEQLANIELMQRLYRTPDAHMTRQYVTGHGNNRRIRTDYNVSSIIQSVGSDRDLDVTQYDKNTFEVVKGTEQKVRTKSAAITDAAISAEDLTVANGTTDSVQQNTDKFFQGVLDTEHKLQKISSDKPFDTNEAVHDQILAENAKLTAANRARLEYAQSVVRRLKSELSDDQERSQVELMELQRQLNEAEADVQSLFSDTTQTDVLDNAGNRKTQRQVYNDSHLKMRLKNTSELLRKKFEETNKKTSEEISVGIGADIVGTRIEAEASAAGLAGPNVDHAATVAGASYAEGVSNNMTKEQSVAMGHAGGNAFIKLVQAGFDGYDPATGNINATTAHYANIAASLHHRYLTATESGDYSSRAAALADTINDAVSQAGFSPSAIPNSDIEAYYSTRRGYYYSLGIKDENELDQKAAEDTILEMFMRAAFPTLGLASDELGTVMRDAYSDYRNSMLTGTAKTDADNADTIARDGVARYNATIAAGGTSASALTDASAEIFGGGGFTTGTGTGVGIDASVANTVATLIDDRLNTRRETLDEKTRSTIDKNLGGADVQMNRAGGKRVARIVVPGLRGPMTQWIKWDKDASKDKEHMDNRKVLVAHSLINRALSMLEDAKRTQSNEERVRLLTNARTIFSTAKQPLLEKHYENMAFETEFTNAEGQLAANGNFSASTSRNEAAIDEMRDTMTRIFNNYVK